MAGRVALLITGQIRDNEVFVSLMNGLSAHWDGTVDRLFVSWDSEIRKAQTSFGGLVDDAHLRLCSAGDPLPISGTIGRDFGSFLAQYQQVHTGITNMEGNWGHLLRVRADFPNPPVIGDLLSLLEQISGSGVADDKTLIFGAGHICPYFYEDRVMIISRKAVANLATLEHARLYLYDYYNIFPEFLFYSTICGATKDIVTHDHRFRYRACEGHYTEYDYFHYGDGYGRIVESYLESFSNNILFIKDAARLAGCEEEYSRVSAALFPHGFGCSDLGQYRAIWASNVQRYLDDTAAIRPRFGDGDFETAKRKFQESMRVCKTVSKLYNNSANKELIEYYEGCSWSAATGIHYDYVQELYGSSLYIVGRKTDSLPILENLFTRGYFGYEAMFYLFQAYSFVQDRDGMVRVYEQFVRKYPDDQRVVPVLREAIGASALTQ